MLTGLPQMETQAEVEGHVVFLGAQDGGVWRG